MSISAFGILEDFLTSAGFHVTILTKTEYILGNIALHHPDLVLVDYIFKKNEQTRHIPVILMTAYPRVLLSLGTYSCDELLKNCLT